jgi:hypothetical protein
MMFMLGGHDRGGGGLGLPAACGEKGQGCQQQAGDQRVKRRVHKEKRSDKGKKNG